MVAITLLGAFALGISVAFIGAFSGLSTTTTFFLALLVGSLWGWMCGDINRERQKYLEKVKQIKK